MNLLPRSFSFFSKNGGTQRVPSQEIEPLLPYHSAKHKDKSSGNVLSMGWSDTTHFQSKGGEGEEEVELKRRTFRNSTSTCFNKIAKWLHFQVYVINAMINCNLFLIHYFSVFSNCWLRISTLYLIL